MIYLNERDRAIEVLGGSQLGEHPSDTMRMIARYYIDNGLKKAEVIKRMEDFVMKCKPNCALSKWEPMLNKAYGVAAKQPALDIDFIAVTQTEMSKIAEIPVRNKRLRRLAFTMLCLAKYWKVRSPQSDFWVLTKETQIFEMANIKSVPTRQRCQMFRELSDRGMIQLPRKVDGKWFRVLFVDEQSDESQIVMRIRDFRSLGFQYLRYLGQPFCVCENCGIVFAGRGDNIGRPKKYCDDCATKISIQQRVDWAMRKRNENKERNDC
jgi:hypothetical protein